jgi:ABC-type glycerol-3-phosphate transport system substrate-binding protein
MSDAYIKGDSVDFDNKTFRELAEYIKENSGEIINTENDPFTPVEKSSRGCVYDVGITLPHLIRFYGDSLKDIRVMGLPSGDGRGPAIAVSLSVGISAQTNEKKVCVDFVKTLFSEEIQEKFAEYDTSTPVNVKAFKKAGLKSIEKYNANYNRNKSQYSRQELMSSGLAWCEVDKSAVDEYEKVIRSCSCSISEDPSISVIVKEEMPAYLTGQKSLDDVIKIINDRAKTVVSERG